MPVIVAGDYGKGRSLAFTTDSLWRYGFVAAGHNGDDGRQYTKLWENAIRWLIQDPDLRNLHVDSDAVEYVPGAPVRVAVRLLGRDYQPLPNGEVTLTVTRGADPAKATPVSTQKLTVGEDGTQTVELGSLGPGVYRVIGKATIAGRVRSTPTISSSYARAAASSTARSATAPRSRPSPRPRTARRSARSTPSLPDWRSILPGSFGSIAGPMSSCGAAQVY